MYMDHDALVDGRGGQPALEGGVEDGHPQQVQHRKYLYLGVGVGACNCVWVYIYVCVYR